ncbi:fumarylacetoacetate hydrolase family protein [Blastococcus haudaquaticus]|uniref:2-keto-4-pentenoate hydratase/2-oxohepta-3-ene-1,7-dioic acid hydratase (Catechol pathway) n=1 Tax=Blastococcus haudaquaticus TaxID=1938745 RepID=A0A286GR17_9ACTN|nr:fumarylacetoacetate hydrolase family protein [Blastococcus haudaquaticus]SOD97995.1 2-keto-4-pentenoate hydratase/2-oxohepta-3-ene-1,7-dioic acid hydratase (catechol pathway) [Blastococcus haudaquaticus]
MRLTTVRSAEGHRVGVLDGDVIRLLDAGPTLRDVIAGGEESLADVARRLRSGDGVPVPDASFGPLLDPPSVRDFLTYEAHLAELAGSVPDEWYEKPLFYFSNPASITGPYDDVRIPPLVTQLDYELEVGVVVGRAGSDLTPAQAADHILGYTIFNDWSARDLQVHEFKFPMGPSKSKDAAITLGPWLVTADELADFVVDGRLALTTEVRLNGVRTGGDVTSNMAWSFADLVAYASRGTVVRPGDVMGSGTCGTGCLAEIRRTDPDTAPDWLAPGDVVRIEVEQLGFIENRLVPGPQPVEIPRGRRRIGVGA